MTESDADRSNAITKRDEASRRRVLDAAAGSTGTLGQCLRAGLMTLVAIWREDAEWWESSGKRGAVGTAKELRAAASRLAGFAVGLDTLEPAPQPKPAPDAFALAQPDAQPLPEAVGDPVMDFLTGKTNIYEPRATALDADATWPENPAEIIEALETEAVSAPTAPVVPPVIDSPFSHPGAPGTGARRPVDPLPYAALPVLALRVGAGSAAREHVSHSYVSSYEQCSLSALLSDASKAGLIGAKRPSWSLIGGKALHAAIEAHERGGVIVPPDQLDFAATWAHHLNAQVADTLADLVGSPYADPSTWHEANGGREGYDWWRVEGEAMLRRYVEFHDAAWRETNAVAHISPDALALEMPYSMNVRSLDGTTSYLAEGIIDAVWRNRETGVLTVVDYKSGRNAPTSTFQLGEYAHALAVLLGGSACAHPSSIRGQYWLARKGCYSAPISPLEAHPIEELAYRYEQAMRGTRAGIFSPHPDNLCVSCGVRDYCPAGQR